MINENMYKLGATRSAIRELFEYGNNLKKEIGEENVFDFTLGNPSVLPPKEVNESIKKVISENEGSVHAYTSQIGLLETRKAISEIENKRNKTAFSPSDIFVTSGAAASLSTLLKGMLSGGEEVIVLTPYFPEYKVFIEGAGGIVVESPTNPLDYSIDLTKVEKAITKNTAAIIINSPNNPSGAVYSENSLIKLAEILSKKEKEYGTTIYIISDEPYREIVFDGEKVSSIVDLYDDTVICYSFSKSLSLPGERIGYVAISPKAKDNKKLYLALSGSTRNYGYVCPPSLFQMILPYLTSVKSETEVYKTNRDILVKALNEYGYTCPTPKGAFYLFVKSPTDDAVEFSERAKKEGLLVVPSDSFGVKGYLRIATCVSTDMIKRSLKVFEKLAKLYKIYPNE